MRQYDSSITRVEPVCDQLRACAAGWVRQLLSLPKHGAQSPPPPDSDLTFIRGFWGQDECSLLPPAALLAWLVNHLQPSPCGAKAGPQRSALIARHRETIECGLDLLQGKLDRRAWYILEGPTCPDALLETPDALVVVEGKRTEPGPTTYTRWKADRHQIWRHMDAAWEIRERRAVYGLFLVEGKEPNPHEVPTIWRKAAEDAMDPKALAGSFPHRNDHERKAITKGFLGVATWQRVCDCFGIDYRRLPHTAAEQIARRRQRPNGLNALAPTRPVTGQP